MPTLEPSREGFTQSGRPIAASARANPLAGRGEVDLGHRARAKSRFRVSLSMQTAEASTSEPT